MDLTLIDGGEHYASLLAALQQRDEVAFRMDFDGDTNVPDETLKYNRITKRFEEWDAGTSSWIAQEVTNLAANSVGSSQIVADAVTDAKARLDNNGYLRARNAANSADLSLVKATSTDNTRLNAATTKALEFSQADTTKWAFDASSFDFYPITTDTLKIGKSAARVAEAFLRKISLCDELNVNGGPLAFKVLSAHALEMWTNGAKKWEITSGGVLTPNGPTLSIGDGVNALAKLYVTEIQPEASGTLKLHSPNSGVELWTASTKRWSASIGGDWLPASNGTYNIGSNSLRANNAYAQNLYANYLKGNASGDITIEADGSAHVLMRSGGAYRLDLASDGIFDFQNQDFVGSGVTLAAYWKVKFGGVVRYIPVYQ